MQTSESCFWEKLSATRCQRQDSIQKTFLLSRIKAWLQTDCKFFPGRSLKKCACWVVYSKAHYGCGVRRGGAATAHAGSCKRRGGCGRDCSLLHLFQCSTVRAIRSNIQSSRSTVCFSRCFGFFALNVFRFLAGGKEEKGAFGFFPIFV